MSRYRPPSAPKTPIITAAGEARLRQEFEQLWRVERPRVTHEVSEAAKLGDRSENAEYIYGKKRLREIDRRVRYLSKRLETLRVVDQPPSDPKRVYFAAWVTLENEQGEHCRYRIVGPDEFDQQPDYISIDAPLARALLGQSQGAEIWLQTPAGEQYYRLIDLSYEA